MADHDRKQSPSADNSYFEDAENLPSYHHGKGYDSDESPPSPASSLPTASDEKAKLALAEQGDASSSTSHQSSPAASSDYVYFVKVSHGKFGGTAIIMKPDGSDASTAPKEQVKQEGQILYSCQKTWSFSLKNGDAEFYHGDVELPSTARVKNQSDENNTAFKVSAEREKTESIIELASARPKPFATVHGFSIDLRHPDSDLLMHLDDQAFLYRNKWHQLRKYFKVKGIEYELRGPWFAGTNIYLQTSDAPKDAPPIVSSIKKFNIKVAYRTLEAPRWTVFNGPEGDAPQHALVVNGKPTDLFDNFLVADYLFRRNRARRQAAAAAAGGGGGGGGG